MEIIRRNIEIRARDEESRIVEGCAVVFNSWSRDLGGFTEIIRPSAITNTLVQESDIIANINHDNNQLVARWNRGEGTLNLDLREDGLYFNFECPPTERGNELLWNIRNKNIYECSFAFSLPSRKGCERWFDGEDGSLKREILEIGALWDVSVVTIAAYPATFVDARNEKIDVDVIRRSIMEEKEEEKAAEEAKRINEIHNKLDEKLSDFYKNISL